LALGLGDGGAQEQVAAHVAACPDCQAELQRVEAAEAPAGHPSTHDDYATEAVQAMPDVGRDPAGREDVVTQTSPGEAAPRAGATDSRAGTTIGDHRPRTFPDLPVQFGRYELRRCLGCGGMGEVYLAWDTQLNRAVALKVPTGRSRQSTLRRFLREARSAAALDHPYICPVYDYGEIDGIYFLTLKYIDGCTLAEKLEDGPLPIQDAVELCRKLAEGLDAAHRAGVVHRDLKPSNIMLDRAGRPYIMDFGLAHHDADEHLLTRSGDIVGTPAYMSPEQARGDTDQIDSRTDIYSLGAVLYQMLTGRPPFTGNFAQVLSKLLHEALPPPSRYRSGMDYRLDEICRKAMARQPKERFPTAADFVAELDRFLQSKSMIRICVETGNVLDFACDVLLLKHAQDFYGADAAVAAALTHGGRARSELRPRTNQYVVVPSQGAVAAEHVVFLGVKGLVGFEYPEIREFTAHALQIASAELPEAQHAAMTIHGVNYGLDERETFLAQLGGVMDAEKKGVGITQLTVVERDAKRAARLQAIVKEVWPEPSAPIRQSSPQQRPPITAGVESNTKPHIFVAMPFQREFEDVYAFGIQGPVNEAGYLCERVDMATFTGDILDRIKSRIATARLVIADLSGANANVYLEVGYAWGTNRPTLLLCRNCDDLKFDVRSQRCIVYDSILDLSKKLRADLATLARV
jgi:hypothetical protein